MVIIFVFCPKAPIHVSSFNVKPQEVEHSYKYDDVTTYGGCGDSLMLVVEKSAGSSHKLFYSMPRSKVRFDIVFFN